MKHILFVDDSPVLLRTVKGFFGNDYKVSIAINAEQAIKAIELSVPDLVFLDYEMPGMNGMELLTLFREREDMKDVPVVFLTAKSGAHMMEAFVDLNPSGYVVKPPSKDRIMSVIERVFES
ncbi:MAG: response regulator [Pseudobutyrivibrio sp.]|nr:response regulator [Pseudobutyrivibrio sp.]